MFLKINNKKGFTLFTALVSLLLISVTLVLLFNMIKTEETYLSLISNQSAMSDLITIGDLARADAFDSFIVALRFNWETSNSNQNQRIMLDRSELDTNWSDFVQIMANDQFFSMNFAGYFATALLLRLQYTVEPPGYKLVLEQLNNDTTSDGSLQNNGERYRAIVNQMFLDGGNKIDVVNCSNENPSECTGSFYITIDATKLSDENYELLPKINVLRHKSQDVIQRPIFGRQVYKIYMPWRGFQALRTARRIAHSTNAETSDNPALFSGNIGLFNSNIHNTLEQARLGVCEPRSCDYRKDLFTTVSADGFSGSCLAPGNQAVEIRPVKSDGSFSNYSPSLNLSYNVKTLNTNSQDIFKKLVEGTTKLNLTGRSTLNGETIVFDNGLEMISGNGLDGFWDVNIFKLNVNPELTRTKQIIEQQSAQSFSLNALIPSQFSINTPGSLAGGFGLFYDSDLQRAGTFRDLVDIPNNDSWPFSLSLGDDSFGSTGQSITFNCAEIGSYTILLKFKETDNRYRTLPSQDTFIWVELRDSFTKYTFPPVDGFTNLALDPTTGYFTEESIRNYTTNYLTPPTITDDWVCLDYRGAPDLLSITNSCVAKQVD